MAAARTRIAVATPRGDRRPRKRRIGHDPSHSGVHILGQLPAGAMLGSYALIVLTGGAILLRRRDIGS